MSASDYTSLRRARAQNNIFSVRNSSINTALTQINTIRNTVVLDEYTDVVPNDWFGVPIDSPECTNCATFNTQKNARREDSTAPPLYTIQAYTYMKNYCKYVVTNTTNTVIKLNVSTVEIIYDSTGTGYVLIIGE